MAAFIDLSIIKADTLAICRNVHVEVFQAPTVDWRIIIFYRIDRKSALTETVQLHRKKKLKKSAYI